MSKKPAEMTIQQFIKYARGLKERRVLEYSLIFHEALQNPALTTKGIHNPHMIVLRRLGYFTLHPGSKPGHAIWTITDAGLAATRNRGSET